MAAEAKAIIRIEGDTAKAQEALKGLSEKAVSLGENFSKLLNPASMAGAVIGTTMVAALTEATHAFLETVDATKRLTIAYGLSYDQATQLNQVGEKLGVSSESMGTAMYRLSAEIDNGGKNLKKLGVELRDSEGNLKTQGELFMEVRDKISSETDSTKQAMEAKALFGKQGKELLPILKANKDFLDEEGQSAKDLGIAVTEADVERAKSFKAAKKDAEDVGLAFMMKFARPMMDALPNIMNTLSDLAAKFLWVGDILGGALRVGLIGLEMFASGLDTIVSLTTIAGLKLLEFNARLHGNGAAAEEYAKKAGTAWDDYVKKIEGHNAAVAKLGRFHDKESVNKEKEGSKELTDFEKKELEKQQSDNEKHILSVTEARLKAAQNAIEIENTSFKEIENNTKLSYEARTAAADAHYKKLAELQQESVNAELAVFAQKNMNSVMSEEQKGAEIVAIQNKNNATMATNQKAAADAIAKIDKDRAASQKSTLDSFMSSSIAKTREGAMVIKGIKMAEAVQNTYAGANQALAAFPPPFNFVAAGAVVAAGLANVAEIAGAKFADGAWNIPGAAGAGDVFPALLSPGEMVLPAGIAGTFRERALSGAVSNNSANTVNINVSGNSFHPDMDVNEFTNQIQEKMMRGLRLSGSRF